MRTLIFALLALAVFCEEYHYFHYKEGHVIVDKEKPAKSTGPIFIEFLKTMNVTSIAGMSVNGSVQTPWAFSAKIVEYKTEKDNFQIVANCTEGAWGLNGMKLQGKIQVTGSMLKNAHFHGWCFDPKAKRNYTIQAQGDYTKSPLYNTTEAALRAKILVGQSAEAYQPVHVLNFAVIGFPYITMIKNCTFYQQFKNATEAKPGYLIVGNDGKHCAIVDKEGDKFIHSNPVKKQVTINPNSMIKDFFKGGYTFKLY
jgi:hypothetical protein